MEIAAIITFAIGIGLILFGTLSTPVTDDDVQLP